MKTNLWKNILPGSPALVAGILFAIFSPACAQSTNSDDAIAVEATNAADNPAAHSSATAEVEATSKGTNGIRRAHNPGVHRDAVVTVGGSAELKAGEKAEAVVAIGGKAIAKGEVTDAVVAVLGDAEISGKVGEAVVAVLGDVRLLPGAEVQGDVVSVGGRVERADGVQIGGHVQEVNLGELGLPELGWLKTWIKECVFLARPLSPRVGWVWVVYGVFLLLYALVALAIPRPVEFCEQEIAQRPITTFLMGLLTKLFVPVVILILLATGIGVFVVPFVLAAVVFAGILGKLALLQYLGRQITRHFGGVQQPFLAFGAGCVIITLLYLVPIVGLLVFTVSGMWALGAAVMATFGSARREMPPHPPSPSQSAAASGSTPSVAGLAPMPMAASGSASASDSPESAACVASAGLAESSPEALSGGTDAPPIFAASATSMASPKPAALPDAWSLPRAGFWERMGAAFLDMILVSILGGLVGGPPLFFLVALAYFAGMWAWKGTTIGGVVLKLKVVRMDGGPVTFPVALIRGLAAAFSTVVFFLGFLWIAWDSEKQSWHDKIAGTVVVRLPQTQSLVCF